MLETTLLQLAGCDIKVVGCIQDFGTKGRLPPGSDVLGVADGDYCFPIQQIDEELGMDCRSHQPCVLFILVSWVRLAMTRRKQSQSATC